MIPSKALIQLTIRWSFLSVVLEQEMIKMQEKAYWDTGNYLCIARFVFADHNHNYTTLDDYFELNPGLGSLENLLTRMLNLKYSYQKTPANIIICIPLQAKNDTDQEIRGYFLFNNKELTGNRKFFGFDGIKTVEMPYMNKKLIIPQVLASFQHLLSYDIIKN